MGLRALLALLTSFALVAGVSDGDGPYESDDTNIEDSTDTDTPNGDTALPDDLDLGASIDFDENANTVNIEVADDETRKFIALRNTEVFVPGSASSFFGANFSLTFFLGDQGTDFPPSFEEVVENGNLIEGEDFISGGLAYGGLGFETIRAGGKK